MEPQLLAVIAVIAIALAFDYTNGFHDAANAIATSVSTRALTPRVALIMAAIANLIGAFFGTKVACGDTLTWEIGKMPLTGELVRFQSSC